MQDKEFHEYCSGDFSPDDIVISGISGRFPLCDNVGELYEALMNKKTLIVESNERYEKGMFDLPFSSAGLVQNLDKFDAKFFNIPSFMANAMEPGQRKLLEVSYEAMVDAGYEPFSELKGANIGIYSAVTNEDCKEITCEYFKALYAIGFLRMMNANRCSKIFDFLGPSFTVDAGCSTSLVALDLAMNDLQNGKVDGAVVNNVELCISPETTYRYFTCGMVSETLTSRPFDVRANGIVRTEAIAAMFIQKASDARRVYATIAGLKQAAVGNVAEGTFIPSWKEEARLFQRVLEQAGIHPDEIEFIEGHGTGTLAGDPLEVKAIEAVYCKDRKKPLYLGSIKNNVGHTEASAGACGIIKAILALENGVIPPQLDFEAPNPDCEALVRGDIVIVTDPMPLTSSYIPVSAFGIGGSITHGILKKNTVEHSSRLPDLPRLVLQPGTTEEAVRVIFNYIEDHPNLTHEFFGLLNKLSYCPTLSKPYRGYSLLQNNPPVSNIKKYNRSDNRQVWFVLTGMGCQWPGMGLEMMKIPVFAKSMENSAAVLSPYGFDLFQTLQKDSKDLLTPRRITPAFVSIIAIQIALIDVLRALQIEPDFIIGHSTGELACGYADGCCTAEQTILSAYWRGKCVEMSNLVPGAMAAVGLTWEEAIRMCPKDVYPACHNADDSVTISGLKEPVENLVAELQKDGIFARVVDAYGYAFHCEYIWTVAKKLRLALQNVFNESRPRTSRWLSTSYPEEEWDTENCKLVGAEYFVHNLMSAVLFNDALKKIPKDAIIIEIGPHFLLQSITKRAIGPGACYIGLMKRNNDSNVGLFLESLGKLYEEGVNPKIEYIYPPVKFPAPRGTPIISDLVKWDYSEKKEVPVWQPVPKPFIRTFYMDSTDSYLMDHFIDGKALFPATGYIYLAWNALAKKLNKKFEDMDVVIEDFKIHRATMLSETVPLTFTVTMVNASGIFEIEENKVLVAGGRVREMEPTTFCSSCPVRDEDPEGVRIPGEDIYNELRILGYEYGPQFRKLAEVNLLGTEGYVEWNDNWIMFLDALLLFYMFAETKERFVLPTGALSFKIAPNQLKKNLQKHQDKDITVSLVNFNANTRICRAEGVEIVNLKTEDAPQHRKPDNSILEEYKFVPYHYKYSSPEKDRDLAKYMSACNQLLTDFEKEFNVNLASKKFNSGYKNDFNFEDYINNVSVDKVLLNTLKELVKIKSEGDLVNKKKEIFSNFYFNVSKDKLNTFLVNEYCLKIMFDIMSENSIRKMNVLEINNNFATILPTVVGCFEKFSSVKFKNKCVVSFENNIDEDTLQNCNIEYYPYEKLKSVAVYKSQDVIINSVPLGTNEEIAKHLDLLSSTVTDNGFIVLFHKNLVLPAETFIASLAGENINVVPDNVLEELFEEKGLVIVSKIADNVEGTLYLLKCSPAKHQTKIVKVADGDEWLDELKSSILNTSGNIWLLAEGVSDSGVIGMVNCLRNEPGGDRLRCIFIPEKTKNMPPFDFSHPFYSDLQKKDLVMNVWKDGTWGSFRHITIDKDCAELENVDYSCVHIKRAGDLSSLYWVESPIPYSGLPEEHVAYVCYSALNFKDIMLATGRLTESTAKIPSPVQMFHYYTLGMEFSGITKDGKRICGICPSMGIGTAAVAVPETCIIVPDEWSMQEAATVPAVYMTCYHALIRRAGLKPGESILIHSGTGGIGLAAINIAIGMNCEIFTTVGNETKRMYLVKMFPQLKIENIGCSRNTTFETMVMERTNGNGVDVVLNSLAEDKFFASVRCVARHGRYVEIGKYDFVMDHKLSTNFFLKDISFHGVFLDQLFHYSEKNKRDLLEASNMLQEGIRLGIVKPLPATVFNHNETEKAFRYMTTGKHVGKVLIKMRAEEEMSVKAHRPLRRLAVPITYLYPHKVYVIIGGLGGFGIEVARWLINKGAVNLVLTSRYGVRTPYHHLCLKRWKDRGCNVVVSTRDVSIYEECSSLLTEVEKIGPVGGIFNSAVVLDDAFLENCTMKGFKEVCAPKADATKNLDALSRNMCKDLDHFVCFSSISCGRGNAGQMNYGYANSVMERICESRRTNGLPGLAVQWGIIGEVGIVHRHMGDDAMIAGIGAQRVKSCLQVLDIACKMKRPVVCSYVLKDSLHRKGNKEEILQQIATTFGIKDISALDSNRCFGEMGIDSVTGIEIKFHLENACGVTFTMKEIQEMKFQDVKLLLDKAESEKKDKCVTLVSTTKRELPKSFVHRQPVEPLNDVKEGSPVFVMDVDSYDVSKIQSIAHLLNFPAFALLWSRNTPILDLETVASWYLKKIKEISENEVHIVAYGSASSIALEMVLQNMKCENNIKSFTLISASEYLLKSATERNNLSEYDILCQFADKFSPGVQAKIGDKLAGLPTIQHQIQAVIDEIFRHEPDKIALSGIIESSVKKMKLLENYRPREQLAQNLLIIEDSTELLANDISEVKSELSKICSGKITFQRVPGIATATEEGIEKIASILNASF